MSTVQANAEKSTSASSMRNRGRKSFWFGVFVVGILTAVIFAIAYHNLMVKRQSLEVEVRERQKTIVTSRTEMVQAWLEHTFGQTQRLVSSELFQLFASEVDKLPDGIPMLFVEEEDQHNVQAAQLFSQLPLMHNMLADFKDSNGFLTAKIVNSKGELYISTEAAAGPLSSREAEFAAEVIRSGRQIYAPVTTGVSGLVLETYIPIMAPMYERQSGKPVAVTIFSLQVDRKLGEFLSPGMAAERGRSFHIVQSTPGGFQEVVPGPSPLRRVEEFPVEDGVLPFALRTSLDGTHAVYSTGFSVPGPAWWVVAENNAREIQNILDDEARSIFGMAGLLSLVFILLVSAIWWRLIGREQSSINKQFRELLVVIEEQKKLLDSINNAITDPVSLSDENGVFRYANKAFAQAVGRSERDIVGLDGPAIFGFDTAKRLNASDQHVLMTGESVSVNEVLWLQSKRYFFQISKAPLRDAGSRAAQGVVSVFRDITQLVETEERSRRVVQQTINALVRAIEEVDPFLGGHSRIMGGVAGLMARQLRLSDADVATIEAAANLSQVGKTFVPREILLKPGALTAEEKAEMERHVEFARNVLKGIEFDLPVVEAIYQMNERLDGGGYPRGLSGDEISMHARVLAVANAFAAMAKPRSYRPALPVDEVLKILAGQKDSYDPDVVAALREVLDTPAGERIAALAAASQGCLGELPRACAAVLSLCCEGPPCAPLECAEQGFGLLDDERAKGESALARTGAAL